LVKNLGVVLRYAKIVSIKSGPGLCIAQSARPKNELEYLRPGENFSASDLHAEHRLRVSSDLLQQLDVHDGGQGPEALQAATAAVVPYMACGRHRTLDLNSDLK